MTQEVKVDLQLHLEVDCSRTKEDIKQILEGFFKRLNDETGYLDLIAVDIHSIQEEAEIYGTENSSD
jgi:hypothetical protein